MNVEQHWDPSINALIRELQPQAVINDRGYDAGDFGTPERDYSGSADDTLAFIRPTEANQSVGTESWGYRKEEDYYTDRHLIRSIDKYLCREANYLLNVGPRADGTIPPEAAALLRRIGTWVADIREALEDVVPANELTANRRVLLTRRENTLYVHLHTEPVSEAVNLGPLSIAPRRATLLNTGEPVTWGVEMVPSGHESQQEVLRLRCLPVNEMASQVLVIKLEFDRLPESAAG